VVLTRIGSALLAAGGGARFAAPSKLAADLRGRPVLSWAVDAMLAADVGPALVVTGGSTVPALPQGITVVENPRWAEGIATSLAVAVGWAAGRGLEAIVVGLGDQPLVTTNAWRDVATTDAPIAVATYDGRRGNPVRLAAEVWPLLPTTGDVGARAVMRLHPDLVTEVPCDGSPADIDTVEDLQRWS
jgi:CTP:molybdopterin cytidylyltransferase MocA